MPRRSLLNGRHVSGAITRMASQALSMPTVKIASLPPVTAKISFAIAHQAKRLPDGVVGGRAGGRDRVNGAASPRSIEMWLAPALAMVFGIVSGWTRPRP